MSLFSILTSVVTKQPHQTGKLLVMGSALLQGLISYGRDKLGDGHDHRTNTGSDRTPSQKKGDMKRRKED